MHRSESRELLSCVDCGALVDPREGVYGFGTEGVICFECALRRGGEYDAARDRWTKLPDVSDLAEPDR
ncbi:MAG: hypothetical protein ABFS46_06110 [Myxococcota bacterium]